MKKRVVVGLSGGVDSSVAAYLLKEQGYEVLGLFMRNWHDTTGTLEGDCPWYDDHMFAELTAKKLDIPFHFIDLSEQYRHRVVDYMFAEYGRGRTPNPDVLCNREIKFDAFLRAALDLGADYVATGHYCRREDTEVNGLTYHRLLAGVDPNKDQSYFLCQLTQAQLSRALFPIGHLLKPEVRRIAAEQGLATAQRKDSQGICFVGKVDLPVFLQQQLKARDGVIVEIPADWAGYARAQEALASAAPASPANAPDTVKNVCAETDTEAQTSPVAGLTRHANAPEKTILPAGGNGAALADTPEHPSQAWLDAAAAPHDYRPGDGTEEGRHRGAHFFTIGQRKGLQVGGKPEPLFVIATDVPDNILYVGQGQYHPGLYRRALAILPEEMHWIRPDRALSPGESHRFSFRIRYRQPLQGGTLYVTAQGGYIVFDQPQRGVTAGQFAAWYDGEELVGSGVIHR